MGDRSVADRLKDFGEVDNGLSPKEAIEEAGRCLQCKKPGCVDGCPVNIDIPAFVALIAKGKFLEAAESIRQQNLLPAICGRVCPQETQCEALCILGKKDTPIRIGQLERFAADQERAKGLTVPARKTATGKRVAVIGSGPAGIVAAGELAKDGHDVVLYESLHAPGGVLTYGIPSFRLPKDVVKAEIDLILAMGVDLRLNHLVGRTVSFEELEEYDAILLGTGAGLPYFMGIPGENLSGVYSANEFLTRVNLMHAERFPEYDTPVAKMNRVVVVGGGNVAMDAARTARRMGAQVTLVYRRREEDLPARAAEVHHAKEEGIEFITCANPIRILGEQAVTGIECIRMQMCNLDKSGRPIPEPIDNDTFTLDCDVVIQAIGQGPNPVLVSQIPGLDKGRAGNVVTEEDGRTSHPKIFAAGDVTTGAATVIMAMGGAKQAARSICEMLGSR
ncbi:sulfide dehydrogenase (flavoprotein) subunit SudA [Methanospirillum hungatei JF-1]|jgi:glutamate synthase (NADPH/NADH) small chain|uniref:Sulfide dehydrogenase (Flavoprotein) subunit SudA n=1 Tax=Methanospirillum hungatei JF-1 (strain ATCC 27890 / DSM 864 / NBRC 100397 / JF-1) TaxID=323259 RepID=Q2FPP3_METHJ|nr:NADPH-dependent glutamate synthase [Methanospirillum hungatei]ABD40866.1 sulfide dehydrogenase (flavoprotein) subunit SudA [Methanospirillum hungatei JF-1]MBP7034810.1 NADPH-dependent glutamate synthase [Methanospirillum sp.]OQA55578.1 MAG: Sulfide dehydrogenase subunit alpha precursor [Euryarchaeota archaeon ADurb.Bin294]HOW05580.1 NADPH-dependent glutamate synthase [Methanospirillum hungatei]